ncbi:TM2 domain-containing protein [Halopenitus persicus]|uniref:Zinc-ribbon domain-containing protein n=1 Tax=Halopenitus persicus TaxID=1048396 RepID=A0A1H3FP72_9EURY|nr:TM2 domain-containing protein [Halopenitus persicus]SDX92796.1 zinc-ribbon domain-containing protein [Halopenitus persicus]
MAGPTDDDTDRDRRSRSEESTDDDRSSPSTGAADDAGWEESDDRTGEPTDAGGADPDDRAGAGGAAGGAGTSEAAGGAAPDRGGGQSPAPNEQFCSSCGTIIKKQAEICPECGVRQGGGAAGGAGAPGGAGGAPGAAGSSKDRTTAGILALLLGGIGAHKFYLGETGMGLLYLCFSWTFIPAIIGFIEGILYLTKSDEEFQRQYV